MINFRNILLAVLLSVGAWMLGPEARAEVVLRAVTALPKQVVYTQDALRLFDEINKAGKGVVRVQWMGGPEVIPATEQAQAVRNGVVDIIVSPANYHWGAVPESAAVAGSIRTPWELRENGGAELLSSYYEKRLNARYLGWLSANVGFHIYVNQKPRLNDAGLPDLQGFKLRSNPVYQDFFGSLNATNVTIQVPEVYSALERGTVDGVGWPLVGITDFGWEKFLRYRIDPAFYKSDVVVLMNLPRWNQLPANARQIVQDTIAAYERTSYRFFEDEQRRDERKVHDRGVETVSLERDAAQRYLDQAYELIWKRVARQSPEAAPALRAKFYR